MQGDMYHGIMKQLDLHDHDHDPSNTVQAFINTVIEFAQSFDGKLCEYETGRWVFLEVVQRLFHKINEVMYAKHKHDMEEEITRVLGTSAKTIPFEYLGFWESGQVSAWKCKIHTAIRAMSANGLGEDTIRKICEDSILQESFTGYAELNLHVILQVCIHDCIACNDLALKKDKFQLLLSSRS